jgi:hypothetical protein
MATPQMMRIWIIYLTSNLELIGEKTFPLKMRTDDCVGDLLDAAWQRRPASVHDVGATDLELWKIKTPVPWPPRYNLRASEASAPNTNDTPTLQNLLENIKSSSIGSHAEILDEVKQLIDYFREENRENKIQVLVLCPGMLCAVTFVRLH